MKLVFIFLVALSISRVQAQLYSAFNIGFALKANSPIVNLHIGYQFNNIIVPEGITLIEYNQRIMTGGTNSKYLGGRIGYGYYPNEDVLLTAWGGQYKNIISTNSKNLTPWIAGYGIGLCWKNATVEVNKIEFYQVSIGCRVLIEFDSY